MRGWQPGDGRCAGPGRDERGDVCCGGPDRLVCGIGKASTLRAVVEPGAAHRAVVATFAEHAVPIQDQAIAWWATRAVLDLPAVRRAPDNRDQTYVTVLRWLVELADGGRAGVRDADVMTAWAAARAVLGHWDAVDRAAITGDPT